MVADEDAEGGKLRNGSKEKPINGMAVYTAEKSYQRVYGNDGQRRPDSNVEA